MNILSLAQTRRVVALKSSGIRPGTTIGSTLTGRSKAHDLRRNTQVLMLPGTAGLPELAPTRPALSEPLTPALWPDTVSIEDLNDWEDPRALFPIAA